MSLKSRRRRWGWHLPLLPRRHKEWRKRHMMLFFHPMIPMLEWLIQTCFFILFINKLHFNHVVFMWDWWLTVFTKIESRALCTFISNSTYRNDSTSIAFCFMFSFWLHHNFWLNVVYFISYLLHQTRQHNLHSLIN